MDLLTLELPEPDTAWTVPIAIGLGLLALLSLIRKLVFVALVAALLAAGFVAYQSGALDDWVDKGEHELDRQDISIGYPSVISRT
jgi:hypothetical protein